MNEFKCQVCGQYYTGKPYYTDGKLVCSECKQELIRRAEAGIERRLIRNE